MPQITASFTHDQKEVIEQMASDVLGPDVQSFTWSKALQAIVEAYAREHGYEWREGVGQWGGKRQGAFGEKK
jgi:hypothetical protein